MPTSVHLSGIIRAVCYFTSKWSDTLSIHWKDLCWSWNSNTLATWCKELTHLKRPWCWERLKAGGEGDNRGWDGTITSLAQWTWVWINSRSWWWAGKPGMLQYMGSQRVGHDWATELNLKSLSHVWLFATQWTIHSLKFSRPQYWSRQRFPSLGDIPNPGIEPRFPALQVYFLPSEPQRSLLWGAVFHNDDSQTL